MKRLHLLVAHFFPVVTGLITPRCPSIPGAVNWYYWLVTDTCYYEWPGQAVYDDARSTCSTNGLHLVQLEDPDEQVWLSAQINIQHWLGLSKTAGVWRWGDSGQVVPGTDPRWATSSSGNRAYKQTSSQWAATQSTSSYAVICELEPTTATTTTATLSTPIPASPETATTTNTSADISASPETDGGSCSGLRKFSFPKFTQHYLETSRIIASVGSLLECTVKCIKDGSCSGVRFASHGGVCALLSPSPVLTTCNTDEECYRIVNAPAGM